MNSPGFRPHFIPVFSFCLLIALFLNAAVMAAVPIPVQRGQTLFFGGQLIHGSSANRHAIKSRRTFIGHYMDDASEEVARVYHPVIDRQGNTVSRVGVAAGGGPCGDHIAAGIH